MLQSKKHFDERDGCSYSQSMFQQWFLNREKIKLQSAYMFRAAGGGRKCTLGSLEDVLLDEILELRIMKIKLRIKKIKD